VQYAHCRDGHAAREVPRRIEPAALARGPHAIEIHDRASRHAAAADDTDMRRDDAVGQFAGGMVMDVGVDFGFGDLSAMLPAARTLLAAHDDLREFIAHRVGIGARRRRRARLRRHCDDDAREQKTKHVSV